jgi:hypothetical protein
MIEVPMTDAQFAAATERLRAHGIALAGSSGILTKEGITARYEHANGKLTVEIVDKPFFLPIGVIESRLWSEIQKSMTDLNT